LVWGRKGGNELVRRFGNDAFVLEERELAPGRAARSRRDNRRMGHAPLADGVAQGAAEMIGLIALDAPVRVGTD
jgi:hypothetical protein